MPWYIALVVGLALGAVIVHLIHQKIKKNSEKTIADADAVLNEFIFNFFIFLFLLISFVF